VFVGGYEDGFHSVRVYIRAILYDTVASMHGMSVETQ
jgi:hypothetical protein